MAMYVITFEGDGDTEAAIVSGRDALEERIKEMFDEGYWCHGESGPDIYKLEKKMTVQVETKITLKGE